MSFIKEDLNEWRHIQCFWDGRESNIKMTFLIILTSRYNAVPIKPPTISVCIQTCVQTHEQGHAHIKLYGHDKTQNKFINSEKIIHK